MWINPIIDDGWSEPFRRRKDRIMTAIGPKEPRIRDPKYLAWLRTRPCCICGAVDKIDACHIRSGSIAYAKRETGMAEKPDDKWAVSMCRSDHTKQHAMNELEFYRQNGIDPFQLARKYYASATLEGHSSPTARKPGRPKKLGKRIASRPFGPSRGFGK